MTNIMTIAVIGMMICGYLAGQIYGGIYSAVVWICEDSDKAHICEKGTPNMFDFYHTIKYLKIYVELTEVGKK